MKIDKDTIGEFVKAFISSDDYNNLTQKEKYRFLKSVCKPKSRTISQVHAIWRKADIRYKSIIARNRLLIKKLVKQANKSKNSEYIVYAQEGEKIIKYSYAYLTQYDSYSTGRGVVTDNDSMDRKDYIDMCLDLQNKELGDLATFIANTYRTDLHSRAFDIMWKMIKEVLNEKHKLVRKISKDVITLDIEGIKYHVYADSTGYGGYEYKWLGESIEEINIL